MKKKEIKVLCVGSMGKDIFFPVDTGTVIETVSNSHVEKQFCFGYGSKVHVDDRFVALGGCACNVSIGLSRLGIDARALGNIGDDADGQWIVDVLKKEEVDISAIRKIIKSKTDISVILIDASTGERTIFVNRDVGEKLVFTEKDLKKVDWCFIGSLYGDSVGDNMHVLHDAIMQGKIKLAYNPGAYNIAQDENIVLDLIHHANVVFTNKSEACDIISYFDLDLEEADFADEKMLIETLLLHMKSDDSIAVVTDGRRGAWAGDKRGIYHVSTIEKKVHDATGAGDAFASGFLGALFREDTIDKCIQCGSANGDAVVDYYGAQEGLLTYGTMKDKLHLFDVRKIK
ncbi:MAG: hypothetical protein CR972_00410 [Candidatus Moraniibacteriota bacterium]|nr:MAG: hypothetical protein CR972_00410 [Candidatus Moranbacteria bacterium]